MDLSAKMPAQMDSTLPASMPSTMKSGATSTGGGQMTAPVVEILRDSQSESANWECVDDKGTAWETEDKKLGSEWEASDRIED